VLYEARSEAISEGFSEERATLWTPAGEALATATQRIVVFD
jgi:acyl-CoA thioesterase